MQLELRSKEDSQLVQKIVESLASGADSLPEELETQLTPEVLGRIEGQLIKAVMANGQLKVCVYGCSPVPCLCLIPIFHSNASGV